MKLLIGADLVPTKSNSNLFCQAETETLIGSQLKKLLAEASYRIFNLETPLADQNSPIDKCGPCFCAGTQTVNGIKALGADFLTLANNHILDQGEPGLLSTMSILRGAGISFAGAGKNVGEAAKPYITEIEGKRIGIFCCAEHEFSIADKNRMGANPYDPLESFDTVASLKEACNFLIVLYHGGKEYYRYPSPNVQKLCRKFVDKGADLVVCQHTHCIGCEERYATGTIVYGQGNFLFDNSEKEAWQTGLLIGCEINKNGAVITYYPLRKHGNTVCLADENDAEFIMAGFRKRSEEIKSEETMLERYRALANESYMQLMRRVNGKGTSTLFFRMMQSLFGEQYLKQHLKKRYDKNALLVLRNTIESESWRELIITAITEKNSENIGPCKK